MKKIITLSGAKELINYVDVLPEEQEPEYVDNSYGRTVSIHGWATRRYSERIAYDKQFSRKANNLGLGAKITSVYVVKDTPSEELGRFIKEMMT